MKKVEGLAKIHSKRTIRPWMYSIFIETIMTTISFCLEEKATYEVSTAWTNLGAFVLRELITIIRNYGRQTLTTHGNQSAAGALLPGAIKVRDHHHPSSPLNSHVFLQLGRTTHPPIYKPSSCSLLVVGDDNGLLQDAIVTTEGNHNSFSGDLDEEEIMELQSQVVIHLPFSLFLPNRSLLSW